MKKEFNVSAIIEKFSLSDGGTLKGFWWGNDNSRVEKTQIPGKTGSPGDVATKLGITINDAITSSNPYMENSGASFSKSGIKYLKFDIKIESTTKKSRLMIGGMDGIAQYGNIIQDGKWLGGKNKATSDGWVHMELASNHYENKIVLNVDGQELYNDTIKNKASGGLRINLYQMGVRTDTTRAWMAFDNMEWSQHFIYALSNIEYMNSDGDWIISSEAMPANTSKIRIKVSEPLDQTTVTKETVKLYDNGNIVTLSNVAYDADNKYVTIEFGEKLSDGSDVVLKLDETIVLSNTKKASDIALEARMVTEASELAPTNISYKKNSSYLATTSQLKTGDVVSVDMTLNNETDETKPMAAFVSVIQNGIVRSLGVVERHVSSMSSEPITVTLPALSTLDAEGDIKVKIMICNSILESQPYIDFYELK